MNWKAGWIKPKKDYGEIAPAYAKSFEVKKAVKTATLTMTALGTYEAEINGKRVSDYVLAPGWTSFKTRLQYQEYDVTDLLDENNRITITVGKGWYRSEMSGPYHMEFQQVPAGVIAQLDITYEDGSCETMVTDEDWKASESPIRYSDIYHGETCDGRIILTFDDEVEVFDGPFDSLIPQEGEKIIEADTVYAARIFTTPKGETVVDFGQNLTGYVEITVDAKAGDVVKLSHAEVLDADGNFYTENYRKAKADFHYICRDGKQTYHPRLTFFGFRMVRIDQFPGGAENAKLENFKAIVVHSDLKRTGYVNCSNATLNRFFENVFWGQKGNFLDVPTDCPQRDERLGWTGDAEIFVRAAAMNYDVEKFFTKWLGCLAADQGEDGQVPYIVPDTWHFEGSPAGWGDAAVICPWEIYMAYGNVDILKRQYNSMKLRVDYITNNTTEKDIWTGCNQYGDWLGLDAEEGSWSGASDKDLIATAFYAYSTSLVVKAGKILGEDVTTYEELYSCIVAAFRKKYPVYKTQAECAVAVYFKMAEDIQATADQLAAMVEEKGHMTTGFLGTPYLLYALSEYGHADLAYTLLLKEEYPSWLYQVNKGATTVWEHLDGLKEDGTFWSAEMNSFNHYAYGVVIDWVYSVAAGIRQVEGYPGYEKILVAPKTDDRLDWLEASIDTRKGTVRSKWSKQENFWRYDITTPVATTIIIDGRQYEVEAGTHLFFSERG